MIFFVSTDKNRERYDSACAIHDDHDSREFVSIQEQHINAKIDEPIEMRCEQCQWLAYVD